MAITGYTFDKAKVTAASDASLYDFMNLQGDTVIQNKGNGMRVQTNGLVCEIGTGQALIQGRLVEITAPETVTIPSNSQGFLCITVDLSQVNTSAGVPGQGNYMFVLGQLKVEFVQNLVTEDINNGGRLYNFNLGQIVSTDSEVKYTMNIATYQNKVSCDIRGNSAYWHAVNVGYSGFEFRRNIKSEFLNIRARLIRQADDFDWKLIRLGSGLRPIGEGVKYRCKNGIYTVVGGFRGEIENGKSVLYADTSPTHFKVFIPAFSRPPYLGDTSGVFFEIGYSNIIKMRVYPARRINGNFFIYLHTQD